MVAGPGRSYLCPKSWRLLGGPRELRYAISKGKEGESLQLLPMI